MNYCPASDNRRHTRTFVATLLSYMLLTTQLTPLALAANSSASRNVPAKTSDIGRKKSEGPRSSPASNAFAPVPVPLRVTAAGLAPIITATKVDSFPDPDGDGRVSPGQTVTYSVTINNTGPDPAFNVTLNDTVDPNTTIVGGSAVSTPIAFDDAFNVVGNVRIQPNAAQGLLANDINPNTGTNSGLTASGPTTSTQGGQVAINADGSYSYNPPAGFTGADTFTCTVTSPNGVDTAIVTLTLSTPVWFVNNSAPVGGDGRLTNPFNCYTGTTTGGQTCFSDTAADDPGDSIFLFSGNYTGGFALANNQRLIGQGATDTLANIAGVTVPTFSDPLPATGGASPVITTTAAATTAIPLGSGNHLRGFTVGNTTGTKISGNSFGTLTVGNNTTPDVILNGSGRALGLVTGTFAATSGFASVATTSSTAQAILLTGLAGTVSFGSTTVSGATTQGIVVSTTTADIDFGNASVSGGTDGVSLQNNTVGTRTFGTLVVSGGSGNAFLHGAGGGNVTVGGAATLSSAGDAISVSAPTNGNLINFQAATSATRTAAGGNGVNWAGTAGAMMTFNALTIQTNAGTGLNATVGGAINVTNGTGTINNTVQAAPAIIANGIALNANFSGINSSGGTNGVSLTNVTGTSNFGGGSLSGASGATFLVSGGTASTTFTGGVTQANNAAMVSVLGGHSGSLTFNTGTLSATNGTGLQFDNADGTYNFNGTTTLNGGDAGIDIIGGSSGTFTFATTSSITNPSGTAVNLMGSTASITYSGNISKNNAGFAIDIFDHDGGTVTFQTGSISSTGTSSGIRALNSDGATFNFNSPIKTLNTGANNAVTLTSDTGSTFNFGGGGLDIDTTSGTGFRTEFGGTINVTGAANTIDSTTGTALNVFSNTTIGAGGLTFRSISANGGTNNGVTLDGTGAGAFTVTGNSGAGTGGTIQNKNGADNQTTQGIGIFLNNVQNVSISFMSIQGCQNYGIRGNNVTGFTLDNSTVGTTATNGTSNTADTDATGFSGEGSVRFFNLLGSATISNSTLDQGFSRTIALSNDSGTLNRLTITNSTVRQSLTAATASDSFFAQANLNAIVNFTVTGASQFTATKQFHIQTSALGTSTMDIQINGACAFSNINATTVPAGGGLSLSGGGTDTLVTFNINGNSFRHGNGATPGPLNAGRMLTAGMVSGAGKFDGKFTNNTVGVTAIARTAAGNGADGIGIFASGNRAATTRGTGTLDSRFLIQNNTIKNYGEVGILVNARQGNSILDATILGNIINEPGPAAQGAFAAIWVNSGALPGDSSAVHVVIGSAGVAGDKNTMQDSDPSNATDVFLDENSCGGCASTLTLYRNGSVAAGAGEALVRQILVDDNNPTLDLLAGFTNGSTITIANGTPPAPAAPETEITIGSEAAGQMPNGASVQQTAAPSSTDSIASRPFISSQPQTAAATTKPAAQTPVASAVVVDPGVRYRPKPKPVAPPVGDGLPPVIVGDNLTWNVGTLPANSSVTITFQVVVDNPFMGAMPQVSNQGTVTAAGGINVLTDDPSVGGMNDPTVTGVTLPPDLFVRDASVAEPNSGSTSMIFTLALSTPAPAGGIVVNLSTANGTATGGTCLAGDDYESVTGGTATFAAGEQIKTFPVTVCADATAEADETFTLNVNNAPGAIIVDGTGTGTITANVPGTILISELRTSGPNGAGDDFVEIYNNTDTPHTVPAGGYGLFKRGADCNALPVLIGTIPATTVIPARGHYLFVGSTYSLGSYAAADVTLTTDIESDFNVGLFSTVDPLAISTANRLDAVGFGVSTGGVCDLLLEGTTLAPASGSTSEYSFVRKFTLVGVNVPTPTDGNDNAADFTLVSTTPSTPVGSNAAPGLGAPGPENLGGPNLKKFSQVGAQLIDPMVAQPEPPNLFRDTTPDPANNSTFGTIASRRRFINNTGGSITRLRFRIYEITTFPSPAGTADLRARTAGTVMVTVTGGSMVTVLGTTLETPPAQPNSGGLNSSLAAGTVTLGTPLANGASINLQFLFGVQQTGSFRVFVFVEAVP